MWLSLDSFIPSWWQRLYFHWQLQLCVAVNNLSLTSSGVEVGYPMKDDTVQEQGRGVDLHGPAQKAVEDPNIPEMGVKKKGMVKISTTEAKIHCLSVTNG